MVINFSARSRRRRIRYAPATQFAEQYRRRGEASLGSSRLQRRNSQRLRFVVTPAFVPIATTRSSVTVASAAGKGVRVGGCCSPPQPATLPARTETWPENRTYDLL
ncbi:hypothetical protein GCM10009612_75640 [Streptomyces beijiangensis]